MRKYFFLLILIVFTSISVYAQKTITGTVVDENREALIGVSVVVKGTSTGTITDLDGNYRMTNVPNTATLVFSYVGMQTQEQKVTPTTTTLNVTMRSDALVIDEVVVTAMGIQQEKKRMNFAVQSVNSDAITDSRSANFVTSLQGKIAGVNVTNAGGSANAGSQIIIRSISSINPSQNNEPLFIVDGMPVSGGSTKAADINPNDIENVTVLKGAAASALYGQEGANGVIMITTKSGKEGKVKVTVNTNLQVDNAYRVPQIQQLYGPGASGFYKDQTGGGWGPLIQPGEQIYDNVGNFLKTGIYQKYDLQASGGTKNFIGSASASYSNNKGVVPDDYLTKTGILLKGSYTVAENLTINMNVNVINNISRGFGAAMSSIYNWPINDDITNYKNADGSIHRRYLADKLEDSPISPLWARYEDYGQTQSTRNVLQGSINWKPIRNLDITGRVSSDQTNSSSTSYTTPRFAKSDFSPVDLPSVNLDYFGTFDHSNSKAKMFMAQLLTTYKIAIDEDYSVDLMGGTELKMSDGVSSSMGGRDFIIPGGFYSMQNVAEVINGQDISMYRTKKRTYGFYGEVKLDYKGLAHISVTGRNDHSSTLDPEVNSYFYPSFTGGIIFSELFDISNSVFSYGKLRGNWAKVGKDATAYLFDRKFKQFPTLPDGGYAADPTSSVAKNLKPEMTTSWEIGTDLRFYDNRTKLDVAYYSTTVSDQIVNVRVSPASGNILETRNEGAVENYGIEATLEQEILKRKDLRWSANINFGLNRGRVISLPDQLVEIQGTQYGDIFPTAYLHGSTTAISGKDYQRTSDGRIICTAEGYPIISPAKGNLIGNREPDFLLGLSSALSYKKATLSFLFDTRKGGDVVNLTSRSMFSSGQNKVLETYRNRQIIFDGVVLQPDGSYTPNTKAIIFDQQTMNNYFTAVSSNFIEDGSYIRLSYVALSYDLTSLVKKTSINELKVSVTGRNLLLLTRYTGSDPQININTAAGGSGGSGIDNFSVPNTQSFNFNLSITF
ncbi:MAG: SusC/RagA family TonB-linked outer membrane protein [Paludibacter sp.]|nr:SusC/RagA family TonB-linked outer membrane protein [Paludibacter sp.]